MEPSDAGVEAGCQGTLRAEIHLAGRRSHSARSWLGSNAIHAAAEVLARLAAYDPARVVIDGLEYREGLNAVGITGGVAGNVIPDECVVTVNYRFAPSLTAEQAVEHVRAVFDGFDVRVVDVAAGALPGLSQPAAQAFLGGHGGGSAAQVRLDRRRAVLGPGHPGRELRTGRPVAGAHARGVRADEPAALDLRGHAQLAPGDRSQPG